MTGCSAFRLHSSSTPVSMAIQISSHRSSSLRLTNQERRNPQKALITTQTLTPRVISKLAILQVSLRQRKNRRVGRSIGRRPRQGNAGPDQLPDHQPHQYHCHLHSVYSTLTFPHPNQHGRCDFWQLCVS